MPVGTRTEIGTAAGKDARLDNTFNDKPLQLAWQRCSRITMPTEVARLQVLSANGPSANGNVPDLMAVYATSWIIVRRLASGASQRSG